MKPLQERIDELVDELSVMEDPQERFGYLIDCAREKPPLPDELKTEPFRIPGCQSQLWLAPSFKDGRCYFAVDSDAVITKGVAGLLAELYSDAPPAEILQHEPDFLAQVGITQHLSPNRRNGLSNVWARIKSFAESCQAEAGKN
ncbi:MAG: SufE family protein [Opitutales bacterium]